MKKETIFTVTAQGNILTGTNKTPEQQKAAQKKAAKRKPKPQGKVPYAERCAGTLSRSVNRTKNNFAQKVGIIKNEPTCHISVVLPKSVDEDFELPVLNDCLKKFFKRITRLYPNCYFVRFYGWTPEAGLHAHIFMRFGGKSSWRQKEYEVREAWGDIVGSHAPHLLKLTQFTKGGSIGYLTSPDIDKELRVVIQRLNGGRVWSIINRNNIRKYKPVVLKLTTAEHEVFKRIMRKLFAEHQLVQSNSEQLKKGSYRLNHLTAEILRQAVEKFLKWRKRHAA